MSVMKSYLMLQNARVTAFTISELLRENQQEKVKLPLPPRLELEVELEVQGQDYPRLIGGVTFLIKHSIASKNKALL